MADNRLISKLIPTGCSKETAGAENVTFEYGGLYASKLIALRDTQAVTIRKQLFIDASLATFPPALLAAIASRETHVGALLKPDGTGDEGHAFGIFQVDKRFYKPKGLPDPYSIAHANQAVGILQGNFAALRKLHWQTWPLEHLVQAAVAAYNVGVKNVQTLAHMDVGTTRNDYSGDVWARAQVFATEITW